MIKGLQEKIDKLGIRIKEHPFQVMILGGLQHKPIYEGKHPYGYRRPEVQKRRDANKVARRQRKINRA